MEHLMLVSLSLSSVLSFFTYCAILIVINFLAFCLDYGALLHLVHRYPLSTLPHFMWSARMGYPVPFTLGLTELTLIGYLTVYTVTVSSTTSTTIYAHPSIWFVYLWVFLFQRISRLAALLRSSLLLIPEPMMDAKPPGQGKLGEPLRFTNLRLSLVVVCFAAWFYLACILRWTELAHHLLVAHSFLVCVYTSQLVRWATWLLTFRLSSDTVSDLTSNQLDASALCLHLIPACFLPYFWSPQSGPARFQWVIELFLLLLVHLYDEYWYDSADSRIQSQSLASTELSQTETLYCALCQRRRHRPLTPFASPEVPEPDVLPCQHPVHGACYRIWQAIAPECTQCKLLASCTWFMQKTPNLLSNPPLSEGTVDEDEDRSSCSWSSDSLDRISSVVSSASSELSIYDDKDVDLQVYLDDVEGISPRHPARVSHAGHYADSSSSDEFSPYRRNRLLDRTDCSSIGSNDEDAMSFWLPSG